MYYVLKLRKTHLLKGDELSTECVQLVGMLWRRTLGDESERSNFVAQGDKCDHPDGNQTLTLSHVASCNIDKYFPCFSFFAIIPLS